MGDRSSFWAGSGIRWDSGDSGIVLGMDEAKTLVMSIVSLCPEDSPLSCRWVALAPSIAISSSLLRLLRGPTTFSGDCAVHFVLRVPEGMVESLPSVDESCLELHMLLRRLPQRLPECESLLSVLRLVLSLRLRVCKRFAEAIESVLSVRAPLLSVGRTWLEAK